MALLHCLHLFSVSDPDRQIALISGLWGGGGVKEVGVAEIGVMAKRVAAFYSGKASRYAHTDRQPWREPSALPGELAAGLRKEGVT